MNSRPRRRKIKFTKADSSTLERKVLIEKVYKIKRGRYVKNPQCIVCKKHIYHEDLDGDYTALVCFDPDCSYIFRFFYGLIKTNN